MIYYILPITAFLFYLLEKSFGLPNKNPLLFFLIVITILFGGLRFEVGTDWFSYLELFNNLETDIEPFFVFLMHSVNILGWEYSFFVFLVFIIAFLLKVYVFKKLSESVFISLILYLGFWFLVYDLNQIRQGFSIGFTALAFYYSYKDKRNSFILSVTFAFLMHYSSLIFFPFYFIRNINLKIGYVYLIILLIYVFAYLNLNEKLINFLSNISGYTILDYVSSKTYSYSEDTQFNRNVLFSFSTIHRIFIFILITFFVNRINADDKLKNLFLLSAFLHLSIYLIFSNNELLAGRLSIYFRFSEVIFISFLPACFKNNTSKILVIPLIVLFYSLSMISSTLKIPEATEDLLPYKNIIFNIL